MRFVPAAALSLLLAACAATTLPVTDGRIETEDQFLATVAGRTITNDLARFEIDEGGAFAGISDGQRVAGTWDFRDGFWCRAITSPVDLPEECQVWEVRGDLLIITRDRGRGPSLRFALPGAGI